MTKKILLYILSAITLVLSFFSWRSIDQAINVPGSSVWLAPMIWFTLFFVFSSLAIVLIKARYLAILFVLCLALSFIFARTAGHLLAFILGFLCIFAAAEKIKHDLKLNIKINLWKSVKAGRILIILGLALVIASQYYFEAINSGVEKIIPKFNISDKSGKLTSKILSQINPDFAILDQEGLTVDELLMKKMKQNEEIIVSEVNNRMDAMNQLNKDKEALMLEKGRRQIAKFAGYDLTGEEKIADVFSGIVNNKINEFFQPGIAGPKNSSAIPLIFAIVLFLTVISIGPILGSLGTLIVIIAFIILVKLNAVNIKKEMKEVEMID